MKNLIALFALIAGIANTASATSIQQPNIHFSRFNEININHSWLDNMEQGNVAVDLDKLEIQLNLSAIPSCGINEFCIPTAVEQVSLPVTEIFTDNCGATHYVGQRDKTPADGLLETIEVIDYMTMTCEIVVIHPTEVIYSTFNPWTQATEVSVFLGTALEQIMFHSIPDPMLEPFPVPESPHIN
jgi:hypothetical protein